MAVKRDFPGTQDQTASALLSAHAALSQLPQFWVGTLVGVFVGFMLAMSYSCMLTSCLANMTHRGYAHDPYSNLHGLRTLASRPPTSTENGEEPPVLASTSAGEEPPVLPSTSAGEEPPVLPSTSAGDQGKLNLRAIPQHLLQQRPVLIQKLLAEVKMHAGDDVRDRCVAMIEGRPGSLYQGWSQAGQDWLLFHNYFWTIPYGAGKYVDIGANHPSHLSNTFFFDRCLGWRGVCVEPSPEYHPLYEKNGRKCTLLKNCLNDNGGKMFFENGGTMGRLLDAMPLDAKPGTVIEVQCKRLPDVLVEHNLADADLATIDIEGAEVPTLRCFPFAAFSISTWVAEIDKSPGLVKLFVQAGYAHVMDVLCPVNSFVFSNVTRVGYELDSIFRLQPALALGPPFLPGNPLFQAGPRAACTEAEVGSGKCPEQVPVIERQQVNYKTDWTLKGGECRLPYPVGSGLPPAEFVHPLSNHPSVAGSLLKNHN